MRVRFLCILLLMLFLCAGAFGAEGEGEQAEHSPFSGNFADAIWAVIAFVVLLLVLRKLVWKQILAGINGRAEYIEKQISDAEETHNQAKRTLEEYSSKLAGVEKEGARIISKRTKEAERLANEVANRAKAQADAIRAKAELDIERARSEAQTELLVSAGDVVLKLGEEILGRSMSEEDNQGLVTQAIERLKAEEKKNE